MSLLTSHAPHPTPLPPGSRQSPFSCPSPRHLCSLARCPSSPTLPPRWTCLSGKGSPALGLSPSSFTMGHIPEPPPQVPSEVVTPKPWSPWRGGRGMFFGGE